MRRKVAETLREMLLERIKLGESLNSISARSGVKQPTLWQFVYGAQTELHAPNVQRLIDFFGLEIVARKQ